jgi:hypothetical protein
MDWLPVDFATPALIEQWRHRSLHVGLIEVPSGHLSVEGQPSAVIQYADILVQAAVIVLGSSVSEG